MNKSLAEVMDENSYLKAMNKKGTALQRELVEALKKWHRDYCEFGPSDNCPTAGLITRAEASL